MIGEIKEDLVSIITPTYNSNKFLRETLDCIIAQTYKNWELIITDDGSTDNTILILEEYSKKDNRIKFYTSKSNLGSGLARNNSIKLAKGRFIAFIDSDDIWLPNKLFNHIKFMQENNLTFSHASYGYIDETGEKIKKTFKVSKRKVGYKDLLKRTEISVSTTIYDQFAIGKFYMSSDRRRQDYFLWLSILKAGHYSLGFDKVDSFYRLHDGQIKKINFKFLADHYKFLRQRQNLSVLASTYYLLLYIFSSIKKYFI
tara:strand:+ start:3497 stop:4267 length:771 start_codon:yes stop_codon:yes gene_type:complete